MFKFKLTVYLSYQLARHHMKSHLPELQFRITHGHKNR